MYLFIIDRKPGSASRTQLQEGYALGISVAEALQVGKLRRARVLAGHQGLGRTIEHVDVIEMPDIRPWVKPNILYLTSFYYYSVSWTRLSRGSVVECS